MSLTNRISWEALRSIDSATFTGSYQALGTPLEHPSYICKLVNNSNVIVTISIDGSTDIDICPATSFWLYDEAKFFNPSIQFLPQGTQFYVKGAAGAGLVYLVSQYIIQN
jgi:hypothetical protein